MSKAPSDAASPRCILSHSQSRSVFSRSRELSEMKNISLLVAGKQSDVGELKSHPAPTEMHLLDVDHQQASGGVPVDGECVGTLGCSGFGLSSRQKASELEIKRRKELTFIVSILTFPKAQNNRTVQLGRHLGKSLVPPPAPSWVSCEIRPGCSGIYPLLYLQDCNESA